MRALDGLHVEVQSSSVWVGANGGITRVGEWAGLPIAEAGDVVLIATEVLLLGSPEMNVSSDLYESDSLVATYLSLKEQNCWLITCQTISSDDMMNYRVDGQIECVRRLSRPLWWCLTAVQRVVFTRASKFAITKIILEHLEVFPIASHQTHT